MKTDRLALGSTVIETGLQISLSFLAAKRKGK